MINKIKSVALVALMAISCMAVVPASSVCASGCTDAKSCVEQGANKANGGGTSRSLPVIVGDIIKVMLFIVGIISVIMIVYGGIKYAISSGDSSKVTSAKNTITYSIVGLIISLLAYTIVNFVLANIK